ncbi:GRP family sugar transporter [Galbibacter mesophilus]|uniref:GRP family sugar transporter n=1 Tax=Galbibacter mesophilus TaxID=379069 RepID=UPI001F5C61E6|nr:GRP family sugar transporter [Galbibacter mesophilus]MCM5663894.1 GRP family sugar transporter [Galbibacter mesophilus]
MYIVPTYQIAVIFTIITMLCWGSWANTQKLASKNWRFELFYWDYVIGIVILSLLFAFTLGSNGEAGRSFLMDVQQADSSNLLKALLGGVIFNLANILLVAAIAIAGMSVAFPVGIGIALILGVVVNYLGAPQGDPALLFGGVFLVGVAIVLDAMAYKNHSDGSKKVTSKGILLSIIAGILMSLFYRFVADSMAGDFVNPETGKLTPYTAVVFFSIGILISNFLFNTILMKKPIEGAPVSYKDYFSGNLKTHSTGILGGIIWCVGMSLSIIAAGKAGYAISYGLGQGATLVGALWGVFIWKEFKNPTKKTTGLLSLMFLFFLLGLGLIIKAGEA